jgi:hypothetical protein
MELVEPTVNRVEQSLLLILKAMKDLDIEP